MAAIQALLNPVPNGGDPHHHLPSPSSSVNVGGYSPPLTPRKKQKVSKDAAVFTRGTIRGECRFPPHEYQDEVIATHHQQYEVYPLGRISAFPRHIPYNSEKKSFLERTGRESFEVFQYEFRAPGDEKTYCMMWDYNIGLVRITPLFRCNGYSKTTPAKMLNRNPGLRDICHSITGGALVAQGYWMPFEAAKAVAATFCWDMRYALTPLFGTDFPAKCVQSDSDKFGDMTIDPTITRHCTEEAKNFRDLELRSRAPSRASSATPAKVPVTPESPNFPRVGKHLRPRGLGVTTNNSFANVNEPNRKGHHHVSTVSSPVPTYRNTWTPNNIPRSSANTSSRQLSSPKDILAGIDSHASRESSHNSGQDDNDFSISSNLSPLPNTHPIPRSLPASTRRPRRAAAPYAHKKLAEPEDDDDENSDSPLTSSEDLGVETTRDKPPCGGESVRLGHGATSVPLSPADEKAACLLMSLRMGQTGLEGWGAKRRRASA